ncbi:MAG TPA: diguanylate cyclase [Nitrospiraceae bacterium]|nr:diguanylate cyclase [Nitrospiraceae bacterium]
MAILLIDDSQDDCLLVGAYLKSVDYVVVSKNSAKEALDYLKGLSDGKPSTSIDLILLDVKMPGFDGLDACTRIKSMKPFDTVPILMVSADTTPGTIQLAFRRGAVDYIRKPIIKAELLAKVAMVSRIQEDTNHRAQSQKMASQNANIQVSPTIDSVTGIMNWWAFDELFELEWGRAAQEYLPISLLFFTLENFKAFNDTYGYATGDECLHRIAQAAKETLTQAGQVVARYRGAEFVALLYGTGAEDAKTMVSHLHMTFEALDLGPIVAVGMATAYPSEGTSRADLLTSAKNAVPNRK